MTEERIMTLHPQGKSGVNILKSKYDKIKEFIINTISARGEISYSELNDIAIDELSGKFSGSITWYIVSVKLDLEARDIIERITAQGSHLLRLKKK